jgi:hypothetical protein
MDSKTARPDTLIHLAPDRPTFAIPGASTSRAVERSVKALFISTVTTMSTLGNTQIRFSFPCAPQKSRTRKILANKYFHTERFRARRDSLTQQFLAHQYILAQNKVSRTRRLLAYNSHTQRFSHPTILAPNDSHTQRFSHPKILPHSYTVRLFKFHI